MACSGGGGGSSRKAKAGEVGSEDDQDEASADDAHEARETAAAAGEARLEQLGLWARMRHYQREGVRRALRFEGGCCMLADEMGLGRLVAWWYRVG